MSTVPQVKPPDTLPANFSSWDKPPDTLPSNFNQWDGQKPQEPESALHQFYGWVLGKYGPDAYKYKDQKGLLQEFHDDMDEHVKNVQHGMERGDIPSGIGQVAVGAGGAVRDMAGMAGGAATGKNAALMGTAAVVPPARLPIAMYYAFQGAKDAFGDSRPEEKLPDAIQRRLAGAATMAGGAAGAVEGTPAFGRTIGKIGDSLLDYAPEAGKISGRVASYGGPLVAGSAALHGDFARAGEALAGTMAAPLVRNAIERGVTGAGTAGLVAGQGMEWLGNLLKADWNGMQPLPLTKQVLDKSGMVQNQPLALPPGPTELPPSSSVAGAEGLLPAQKILVRDPKTGQIKVMYGSGTGPTLYQVGDSVLKDVQTAEAKGPIPKSAPISIMDKADQPYMDAAAQELKKANGKDAGLKDTYDLAQKLKDQDTFVSQSLQKQLFSGTASKPAVKSGVPHLPADPVTANGVPIDPNADLSDVMRRSIAQVQAKKANTVGSASGAASDTAYFAAAKRKLGPKATISEIALEAQRMKTSIAGLK